MRKNLHPEKVECTVTCVCGATFKTLSNKPEHFVETCSSCSPAFTGKSNKVSKSSSVDKFNKKYNLNKAA